MPTRILVILALFASVPVDAATTSWRAYDLKNCKHWSMTPDDFRGRGPRFEKARKLAEGNNSTGENAGWLVIEGGIRWESDEPWYGVCRFESSDKVISCLAGADFPLSGATYKLVREKDADATYVCIRGCDQTEIKMILEMAYEGETVFSTQAARLVRQFESRCHDKAKREKFFQQLNSPKKGSR